MAERPKCIPHGCHLLHRGIQHLSRHGLELTLRKLAPGLFAMALQVVMHLVLVKHEVQPIHTFQAEGAQTLQGLRPVIIPLFGQVGAKDECQSSQLCASKKKTGNASRHRSSCCDVLSRQIERLGKLDDLRSVSLRSCIYKPGTGIQSPVDHHWWPHFHSCSACSSWLSTSQVRIGTRLAPCGGEAKCCACLASHRKDQRC
mmetsp:Transcript_76013/g.180877  ORF Transcript_76013/g.180877 Transcript_76013/m.180877 type:complete len:201 (+) Transcript_76013:417-1019(+)